LTEIIEIIGTFVQKKQILIDVRIKCPERTKYTGSCHQSQNICPSQKRWATRNQSRDSHGAITLVRPTR